MASFTKRGKTWQYTISRMVNGKPDPIRKGGYRTKKEAQVAAADVESDLRKGIMPNLEPVLLSDYFNSWLKTFKTDIGSNTLDRYKTTLATIDNEFEGEAIQSITKRKYQAFLNEYGKTHSKATSRKLNTHIRACVRDAIDEGIIRVDFTRNVTITGEEGKKPTDKHLNYDTSKHLLKTAYNRLDVSLSYYLIYLALSSGMRYSELVGLTRDDFIFFNNTININKTWGYTKRMHRGWGPTKTGEDRIIKMDPETMEIFKQLFKKTPENIEKLVFYSPSSKYKVISNGNINKMLKSMLKNDYVSIHGLRHTHASVLLYEGVSIYYVSERLGHADIQTTMGTYSHVIKELRTRDEEMSSEVFKKMLV